MGLYRHGRAIQLILTSILIILYSSVAEGVGYGNGIAGSPHDFSSRTWNSEKRICVVCHVPHSHPNTSKRYESGLSWNHELSSASYSMYSSDWSSTIDGSVSSTPDGISKLCLSCHDGTIAVDSYDDHTGGGYFIPEAFRIPTLSDGSKIDLRGTHPISIVYDVNSDPNLKDPNITDIGTSGKIKDVLDHGKVQCSTCHDVHDQETRPQTPLLRVGTRGNVGSASELCLVCHNM